MRVAPPLPKEPEPGSAMYSAVARRVLEGIVGAGVQDGGEDGNVTDDEDFKDAIEDAEEDGEEEGAHADADANAHEKNRSGEKRKFCLESGRVGRGSRRERE